MQFTLGPHLAGNGTDEGQGDKDDKQHQNLWKHKAYHKATWSDCCITDCIHLLEEKTILLQY